MSALGNVVSNERRHDLDWLRVLAVFLLIPFHAALVFVLNPNAIMYVKDVVNSPLLDEVTGFVYSWHMPLLFAISGWSTYLALQFRTAAQYQKERLLRLLVPLLFGLVTFIPFTTYIHYLGRPDAPSYWPYYLGSFYLDLNHLDGLNGTMTPMHLWFILYLLVYSLALLPLFLYLRSERGRRWLKSLAGRSSNLVGLALWVVPLILSSLVDILGDKNPLYYLLFFLYGFLLASDSRYQQTIDSWFWPVLALMLEIALRVMGSEWNYPDWSLGWMAWGVMSHLARWVMVITVLGLGHRFLNRGGPVLRYASEASMPFYVLHMTFTALAAWLVIRLEFGIAAKYGLIVLLATAFTLAAYELLVRRWNPVRFLLGMKPLKK